MQKAASFRTRSSRRGSVSPQAGNLDRLASRRSFMMPDGESSRRESRLKDDFDHVSETSSMEERRYADLLGSDSDSDNGGGIAIDNIGHRLYITGTSREKAKQDHLQQLRERILLKELNEVTTKPSVTNHARCKPAKGAMFAEHAIAWQERRQEKLEESARKVRDEEDRGMMASPHINRRSADIAASRGYQGPVSGWEDHFAKYCAKKAAQQNQVHPPGMFTPNINRSAHLDDSRAQESISIGDRLFEDSYAREDRLREMEEMRRESELVDEFTNRPLFEPSRVEYPLPEGRDPNATPEASGARLHALHAEMMEKKRLAQTQTTDTTCRFSPKVNNKSLQIGDRRRKPLHHNKVDYHKLQLEAEDREKALGLSSHSHRPTTPRSGGGGPHPEVRQKPTPNARDFVYRNEKLNIQRQVRLAKIKEEAMEHQSRECTFQPSVNRRSMELFHAVNQYGTELLEAPSLKYQSAATPIAGVNTSMNNNNRSASGMLNATNNNNSGMMSQSFGFGSPAPKQQQFADPNNNSQYQQQQQTPGRSPSSIQRGTPGKSMQQQQYPTATSDRYNLSGPPPPQQHAASANRGRSGGRGASPAVEVAAQKNELNEYVQSFEKQMFQVLDEWRRLEDV